MNSPSSYTCALALDLGVEKRGLDLASQQRNQVAFLVDLERCPLIGGGEVDSEVGNAQQWLFDLHEFVLVLSIALDHNTACQLCVSINGGTC